MKSKLIGILVLCLLGGLSFGIVSFLNQKTGLMEERKLLLERAEELTTEIEATEQELSVTMTKLEVAQEEFSIYEEELDEIRARAVALQEFCEADEVLCAIQVGGLPVNYDVENFRTKQRDSEQTGLMGGFFGSLFGNITQNTWQDYAARGQENRYVFYEQLTDLLEESYWEAVAAETVFDGAFLYYQELGELETEAELFANRELLEKADDSLYESRREELLNALGKYTFDLNCAYLVYNNTLTESETAFLSGLRDQVDGFKALLAEYDPAGSYIGVGESLYGYSSEEKIERGMRVFGLYAEAAKMQVNYLHVDGGMTADQDFTAYRVGTIYGYANRGDIVMIMEKDNLYDMSTWEYRFYDHEGNPLYLEEHQGKVLFLDGEVAAYQAVTEYLQTQEVCDHLVSNAERMFTDYANGVLGSTYQNYAY